VWRFPVRKARDTERFGRLQERVFHRKHSEAEATAWLREQGPYSPMLRDWVATYRDHFDYWISFSFRYWTTFHTMQAAAGKTILVPTAEPDPAVDLPLFEPLFRSARGIVFNSHEERSMILARSAAENVPADVVGVGIEEPEEADAERFRARTGIREPFIFYIGRIDANKGCRQLFDFFQRACARLEDEGVTPPQLVLAGHSVLPIPEHPRIRYLGKVDEQEKYDALAACTLLIMPSFYESLSMVLLEAWALSKPVLVNGHCDVLQGQTVRSGGGLYYKDGDEFRETLRLLMSDERLRESCGRSGRTYYRDHYTWQVIEDKYERLLQRLAADDGILEAVPE
jgi:glycosyltransferase involved in cell wall biosynthesis